MKDLVTSNQGVYTFLPLERVIYGMGSVGRLREEAERLGGRRALVITGSSLAAKTGLIREVEALLGERHAGTYSSIRQHAPESGIAEAARMAREHGADLLVSVGGGSPIDAAKAVAYRLAGEGETHEPAAYLPHIAIPTTLSAAEFSHAAGYTDEARRSKTGISDSQVTPRVVILDPELSLPTPLWLWLSSGIRSLDHAVETLYNPGYHPVNDVLALEAIRRLFACLPRTKAEPEDLQARLDCQLAAWMSYFSPATVPAQRGLSHTIGKRIGATYGVPHGVTSCILLPHVMRFKAGNPEAAARLAPAARSLGLPEAESGSREAALAAAGAAAGLVQRLELPSRLREYNIPPEDFEAIARAAAGDAAQVQDVISILEEAY